MTTLTAALMQMSYPGDVAAAIAKARECCREARRVGADLVVFPVNGRFTPAITSTDALSMTEMARFDGEENRNPQKAPDHPLAWAHRHARRGLCPLRGVHAARGSLPWTTTLLTEPKTFAPPHGRVLLPSTAVVDPSDRIENILAALFHIVVRADADHRSLLLRTDHVLQRRKELVGQAPMRDEDDADHRVVPIAELNRQSICREAGHVTGKRSARGDDELAVQHTHAGAPLGKPLAELLGDEYRPVLSASTTDGDRQVALALVAIARQQEVE